MTRRGQKSRKAEADVEQSFPFSQQSASSDDTTQAGMMAALEEKMKTASEKRRNDKGKKFIQLATKELRDMMSTTLDEAQTTLCNMDATFAKFVLDYASLEDEIRTLWLHILKEQETMVVLAERRLVANTEGAKETEKGQIKGMARAKGACQDMRQIIDSITSVASQNS